MKLYWITENGNEWLTEFLPSAESPDELKRMLEGYVKRTKEQAASLVDGWRRNGEDVSLFPCGEGDCMGETHAISMAIDCIAEIDHAETLATEEYLNEGPR